MSLKETFSKAIDEVNLRVDDLTVHHSVMRGMEAEFSTNADRIRAPEPRESTYHPQEAETSRPRREESGSEHSFLHHEARQGTRDP